MLPNNQLENKLVRWGVSSILIPIFLFSGVNGFTRRVVASSYQLNEMRLNTDGESSLQTDQAAQPQNGATPTKKSGLTSATDNPVLMPDPNRQQAMSLIEDVLIRTHRISPIEYRILAEVEAGIIVGQFDKDRSLSILKNAIETMRAFFDSKEESTEAARLRESRNRKLRFMVLRKLAGVKPDLARDLLFENSARDKSANAVNGEWTDDARAVMSLAAEQISDDPRLAARLFEQSLSLGTADWTTFLEKLSKRDNSEGERIATVLINRLRDSSITSIALRNLGRFVLAPDRSRGFREHFFQSVAVRLQRDIRPDTPTEALESDLGVAREMSRWAAIHSAALQAEFDNIRMSLQAALLARSIPTSGAPGAKTLDVSMMMPAKPGDTQEISDALAKVALIFNPKERDEQYQKLAAKAANKADTRLAEEIMSKISSEAVRRNTTTLVYSPLVKKALSESDWSRAQEHASRVLEPLGRTLAFESIAQAMSKSNEDKLAIMTVYSAAAKQLDKESSTVRVAKAYLLLTKPLYRLDPDRGIETVRSCAYTLNRLVINDETFEESPLESSVAMWVRYTNPSLNADEILNLPDLVAGAFGNVAQRNSDQAISVASGLKHEGMYSLAQLAISKVLLSEAKRTPNSTDSKAKDRR